MLKFEKKKKIRRQKVNKNSSSLGLWSISISCDNKQDASDSLHVNDPLLSVCDVKNRSLFQVLPSGFILLRPYFLICRYIW